MNGWSTGPLLFERLVSNIDYSNLANLPLSAAICELENVLQAAGVQSYNYTTVNGVAGFAFNGSLPQASGDTSTIGSSNFLPISSGGFVDLSKLSSFASNFTHPQANPFAVTLNGVDLYCISQLEVEIANNWKTDDWIGNNPGT